MNFDFGGFDFGGGGGGWSGQAAAEVSAICSASFSAAAGCGAARWSRKQEPGGDLEYQMEIDFWDAVRGAVKKLRFTRHGYVRDVPRNGRESGAPKICPTCGGTGHDVSRRAGRCDFNVPCTRCGGTGQIAHDVQELRRRRARARRRKRLTCGFRAGVASGVARARGRAKEMRGRWARLREILYLRMRVQPHAFFERRGNDL